jgi:hypothetical protein
LVLAGCGGEAGDTSSNRPGLTYSVRAETTVTAGKFSEEEVFARAENMCTNRQTLIRNRFEDYAAERPRSSREQLIKGASYSLFLPGVQFIFDDLRLTGAPEGDDDAAAQIEEMVGVMQYAIESGQKDFPRSVKEIEALFRDFNRLARAYGFDQCTVDRAHYPEIWAAGEAKQKKS